MNADPFQTYFGQSVIGGLQGRPFYEGTVSPEVKAKRRAKNRVARKTRRAQKGH